MKCRDFERMINDRFDTREALPPDVERALASHRATCSTCRAMSARYQALGRAISAWTQHPPVAPAGFLARFPEDWQHIDLEAEDRAGPWIVKFRSAWGPIALAAAVLLAIWAGIRSGGQVKPAPPIAAALEQARPIDPDALSIALAEATSATWDLARATSAPAARVGLEVLDAAALADTTASLSLDSEVGPAEEVLQDVGQRVNEGVRPLSGSARHAFGFLLGDSGG